MHRLTQSLDHSPLQMSADDVVLYRVSPSIAAPPMFEPGPGYEPISPAWIAALVPSSDGATDALWARAFGLTMDAMVALEQRREAEKKARDEAAKRAQVERAQARIRMALKEWNPDLSGVDFGAGNLGNLDSASVRRFGKWVLGRTCSSVYDYQELCW